MRAVVLQLILENIATGESRPRRGSLSRDTQVVRKQTPTAVPRAWVLFLSQTSPHIIAAAHVQGTWAADTRRKVFERADAGCEALVNLCETCQERLAPNLEVRSSGPDKRLAPSVSSTSQPVHCKRHHPPSRAAAICTRLLLSIGGRPPVLGSAPTTAASSPRPLPTL